MTELNIRALEDNLSFGARVEGVTLANIQDEAVRAKLRSLFEDRGMIVFENIEQSNKMHVELSKVFGPLKDHPTSTTPRTADEEAAGVIDMHYVPQDGEMDIGDGIVEVDGQMLARFAPWHFDHCYNDELNYAGILRCPINAPTHGRTGFLDGIECYKQFPKELRDKIEGKNIIYTLDTRLSKGKYGINYKAVSENKHTPQLLKEVAIFPRAMHPAVWTRKTGEKVLHLAPWMAVGIEHDETPEGDKLYDEICHTLNRLGQGTSAYWHQWKPSDMVIWDNTRMLHAVEGCDARYERRTIRSTIRGDYGLGYFEDGKKIGEVNRFVEP